MASVGAEESDDIFSKLKKADPKELERRQEAINERINATFQRSQQRLAELIDANSTLPTTVSSITVLGAPNTRDGFLKQVVSPLLSANRDRPYTQSEVIRETAAVAEKLKGFGMRVKFVGGGLRTDLGRYFPRYSLDIFRQTSAGRSEYHANRRCSLFLGQRKEQDICTDWNRPWQRRRLVICKCAMAEYPWRCRGTRR
jgi:hypothetical protein